MSRSIEFVAAAWLKYKFIAKNDVTENDKK